MKKQNRTTAFILPYKTLFAQMDEKNLNDIGIDGVPPWLEGVQKRLIRDVFHRAMAAKDKPKAY